MAYLFYLLCLFTFTQELKMVHEKPMVSTSTEEKTMKQSMQEAEPYNYMKSQLSVILDDKGAEAKAGHSSVSVKFNSFVGITNWLTISEETFKKIQIILMQEES
jgi:hypothetical protein